MRKLGKIADRLLPLRISQAAAADLESILIYSEQTFGPDIADAYLEGIDRCLALLQQMPFIGALRSDLDGTIRSFRYKRHVIFYDFTGATLRIQRVLHDAQDHHAALIS
ncbi:type II toxin-antitoxin system RelE/ParE family toxin [Novosphingopyxis sp.]|uniref:type II toxin-antitoxin system RelE/ParE family toxin n=1 Tax=Novosphingopyxis sp. TaxID=2709690 RepID=UPI003B5AE98D